MTQIKSTSKDKALLVVLQTWQRSKTYLEESLKEMKELASSAGVQIFDHVSGHIPRPSPSHFLRKGKLQEVCDKARQVKANVIMFNVELTPAQARNIERAVKVPVMDRTGLIIEIFGRRARTSEGKLQVELAKLTYILPRLGGLGGVMSRIGGGTRGTRGPGETELEHDRRKIRKRIQRCKEELEKVCKHRQLIRSGRKRKQFKTVAIVGYTNAGKSTLLNAITGADVYAANQLFATLDPTTRMQKISGRHDILFIDTVGFVRDLPHTLIKAFHATLEEVVEADLLLHVLDASQPDLRSEKSAVESVLKEIKADKKPVLLVLNKSDLLSEDQRQRVAGEWPYSVLISAAEGLGMNSLLARIESEAFPEKNAEDAPAVSLDGENGSSEGEIDE